MRGRLQLRLMYDRDDHRGTVLEPSRVIDRMIQLPKSKVQKQVVQTQRRNGQSKGSASGRLGHL